MKVVESSCAQTTPSNDNIRRCEPTRNLAHVSARVLLQRTVTVDTTERDAEIILS